MLSTTLVTGEPTYVSLCTFCSGNPGASCRTPSNLEVAVLCWGVTDGAAERAGWAAVRRREGSPGMPWGNGPRQRGPTRAHLRVQCCSQVKTSGFPNFAVGGLGSG